MAGDHAVTRRFKKPHGMAFEFVYRAENSVPIEWGPGRGPLGVGLGWEAIPNRRFPVLPPLTPEKSKTLSTASELV